jgi:glycine betaine/proline transport system permease protein
VIKRESIKPGDTSFRKRDITLLLALVAVVIVGLLFIVSDRLPSDINQFPEALNLHLREQVDAFQDWVIRNRSSHPAFTYFFEPISDAIDWGIRRLEAFLLMIPWPILIAATALLGYRAGGLPVSLLVVASLMFMGVVGLWEESMQTLALMGVSVFIALLIGIPLGIMAGRFDRVEAILRPLLDGMQTMPAFVYLIPVLLFFGIARVPSVVATVIYALPPAIRLTSLGIRRVSPATVEAARSFGSTSRQTLFKVQLPLALPTIMAGVNQTIMMALGIVVIAALIGAGGLGREVLISLQRLRVGEGLMAGLAIVFMAIILDRIGQGFSRQDDSQSAKLARGFVLLPNSWRRFTPARWLEKGLQALIHGTHQLSVLVADSLASLVGAALRLFELEDTAVAVRSLFRRHTFLVGSLFLLVALAILNSVAPASTFPERLYVDLTGPVDNSVNWMRDNLYQIGDLPLGTGPFSDFLVIYALNPLRTFFEDVLPWPVFIIGLAVLGYMLDGWRLAAFNALGMFFVGLLGMWAYSMDTLSQVIVAVIVTVLIAIPLGILAARSDTFEAVLRPVLDLLQTIPPFVYLVPVIMLFNIGRVPGIIASVVYALPPGIRLTNLGIRQVSPEAIEASTAFGASVTQTLRKVQLPLALPAIMLGINQVVMMVLAMVIIAGLVGGGGLGLEAVTGLAKNQTGRGIEAGLAIVIMAMIMDRMTQAWVKERQKYLKQEQ